MNNNKALLLYFIPLYSFSVFVLSYLAFFMAHPRGINELIPLIPGGLVTDLITVFIGLPILLIIVGFLICPLMTLFYYGIHRLYRIFSKEHEYGKIELPTNIPFKRLFYRIIFPAFFAISLGMLFNFTDKSSLFLVFTEVPTYQIFMASVFFSIIAFALLAPLWVLDDSGIICFLKKDIGYRRPPETESISRFFSNAFKGYVGITFTVQFVIIVAVSVWKIWLNITSTNPTIIFIQILLISLIVGFPFVLSSYFGPFCIIYERLMPKFVGIMNKFAKVEKMNHVLEKFEPNAQ